MGYVYFMLQILRLKFLWNHGILASGVARCAIVVGLSLTNWVIVGVIGVDVRLEVEGPEAMVNNQL